MKRNIYTTSAKDYYDNAPMMDLIDYNKDEGMDLNMVNDETLDMFYTIQ